jgi:aromatic ring-opening dioxygenase catalytic subunit (LigB family)
VSLELISHRKWPPGIEAAIPRVIQSIRSYHGITDQFNVSNESFSNVMKLFIASGGVMHRLTTKKSQITTQKQDKLLVWLPKKASQSDPVELKMDLQMKNVVSA